MIKVSTSAIREIINLNNYRESVKNILMTYCVFEMWDGLHHRRATFSGDIYTLIRLKLGRVHYKNDKEYEILMEVMHELGTIKTTSIKGDYFSGVRIKPGALKPKAPDS